MEKIPNGPLLIQLEQKLDYLNRLWQEDRFHDWDTERGQPPFRLRQSEHTSNLHCAPEGHTAETEGQEVSDVDAPPRKSKTFLLLLWSFPTAKKSFHLLFW